MTSRGRDCRGEVRGAAPHRPVSGREVDEFEVAQGGDLGHHRVAFVGHLHHHVGGVGAGDDRGRDVAAGVVL